MEGSLIRSVKDARRLIERHKAYLKEAERIARKYRVHLAIENHTDWTGDELVEILEDIGSEYVGVNYDTANVLWTAEDPIENARKLSTYVISTHLKDVRIDYRMGRYYYVVVPLGQGHIPLPAVTGILRKTKPKLSFTIEMLIYTLTLGWLDDTFWNSFEHPESHSLAKMMQLIRDTPQTGWRTLLDMTVQRMVIGSVTYERLIEVEDENFKACVEYAREALKL